MSIFRAIIFLIVFGALFCFADFSRAADVSISPVESTGAQGSGISISISVNNVTNLFGTAFDLIYDSNILSFVSASKSNFLEQDGNSTMLLTSNSNGVLIVGYSRQAAGGTVTGVSGSGTLMTVNFNIVGASGSSVLSFQNNSLCAVAGTGCPVITANWSGGSVAVLNNAVNNADAVAPSVPTNLSASAVSASQISLAWNAATDNVGVSGYNVFRNSSQIASVANTTFTDNGLSAGTTYSYTVSAFDAAGNSSNQSLSLSATTQTVTPSSGSTASSSTGGSTAGSSSGSTSGSTTNSASSSGSVSSTTNLSSVQAGYLKEGDLVRGPDKIKVYIVNGNGYKRHIFNPDIFNMYGHFKWNEIKDIDQSYLDQYKTSDLYRADGDSRVFSLKEIDEKNGKAEKRWLDVSADKFVQLGYNWDQVFTINTKERDYYQEGTPITSNDSTALSLPALVKTNDNPTIYFVSAKSVKKPIQNEAVFNSYPSNKWEDIKILTQSEIDKYSNFDGIIFNNKVYTINNNKKYWVKDENEFNSMKLNWDKIISVNQTDFDNYSY